MKCRISLSAALALICMSTAASAVPVSGQISIGGYAAAIGSAGMGAATGIDFVTDGLSSKSPGAGGITMFGAGSGSFAGLSCASGIGSCGSIQDINGFAAQGALSNFLTLVSGSTTISFDLTRITNVINDTANNRVGFLATGFINQTGFDRTAGSFNLTAQSDNIVSFSATSLAVNVIEPASMALLGASLAFVGVLRRKRVIEGEW